MEESQSQLAKIWIKLSEKVFYMPKISYSDKIQLFKTKMKKIFNQLIPTFGLVFIFKLRKIYTQKPQKAQKLLDLIVKYIINFYESIFNEFYHK